MKKTILSLLLCFLLFFQLDIITYAKPNLSILKNGGFLNLSEQDKQDTMEAMTRQVAKELNITRRIDIEFYDEEEWPVAASNTALADTKWDIIRYNMSAFHNTTEADFQGISMEEYVVQTIAHEVRHTYQIVHMNDGTEYGNQVFAAYYGYTPYYNDINAYLTNFLETDATSYGASYADKYVKNKKSSNSKLKTIDGKTFDPVFYANKYPDVREALGTDAQVLLNHYNIFGINEKRMANALDVH